MSKRSIKTTGSEYNRESTTKSRISRLTKPKISLRPSDRCSSADRQSNIGCGFSNNTTGAYIPVSTTKRSRSTVLATPLRTPSNQQIYLSTNSLTKFGGSQQKQQQQQPHTNESEKRMIMEMSGYVLNYLRTNPYFKQYLPSDNTSLKSMSTKQYISLVTHLLKGLIGNRFKITAKFEEDIVNILEQLHYPYLINKSWLKTPMAMHAYPNMLALLYWLTERVSYVLDPNDFENDDTYLSESQNNSFGQAAFTRDFLKTVKNSFPIWNSNQDDQFELIKLNLINLNVRRLTKFKNIDEIAMKIQQIKIEYEKLVKNGFVLPAQHEREFTMIRNDIEKFQREVNHLNEKYHQQSNDCRLMQTNVGEKQKQLEKLNTAIEQLQLKIATQKMTIEQYQDTINKVNIKSHILQSKQQTITELNDIGIKNQIEKSRLIKRKIDIINKFNNYVHKIFQQINLKDINVNQIQNKTKQNKNNNKNNNTKEEDQSDNDDQGDDDDEQQRNRLEKEICLDQKLTATITTNSNYYNMHQLIEEKHTKLQMILEEYHGKSEKYNLQICAIEKELQIFINKIQLFQRKAIELNEMNLLLRKNIQQFDIDILETKYTQQLKLEQLRNHTANLIDDNHQLYSNILEDEKKIENIKLENQRCLLNIEEYANGLMDEREKNISEIDGLLMEFSEALPVLEKE